MLGWTFRFINTSFDIFQRFFKGMNMIKVIILNPVIADPMSPGHYLQRGKRTKNYPVVFHSRKRYSESEEEE